MCASQTSDISKSSTGEHLKVCLIVTKKTVHWPLCVCIYTLQYVKFLSSRKLLTYRKNSLNDCLFMKSQTEGSEAEEVSLERSTESAMETVLNWMLYFFNKKNKQPLHTVLCSHFFHRSALCHKLIGWRSALRLLITPSGNLKWAEGFQIHSRMRSGLAMSGYQKLLHGRIKTVTNNTLHFALSKLFAFFFKFDCLF